jgi:aminoglycoside 2'-N-acetyltransferase I
MSGITSLDLQPGDTSWPEVVPLDAEVYPPAVWATLPWRNVTWAHAEWRVLTRDDARRVISHVGVFFRDATVDGSPMRIGGIGGVMTQPGFRRRGLATTALRYACDFIAKERAAFALLFCEPKTAPLYERLDWRRFAGTVFVAQPAGTVRFTASDAMVLDLARSAPTRGTIDLCGLPW